MCVRLSLLLLRLRLGDGGSHVLAGSVRYILGCGGDRG